MHEFIINICSFKEVLDIDRCAQEKKRTMTIAAAEATTTTTHIYARVISDFNKKMKKMEKCQLRIDGRVDTSSLSIIAYNLIIG